MSLWNPNAGNNATSLTVQFNKEVSAKAYSNARDEVLLMKGVSKTTENSAERTMKVEVKDAALKARIEDVAGVESVKSQASSSGYRGPHRL